MRGCVEEQIIPKLIEDIVSVAAHKEAVILITRIKETKPGPRLYNRKG